MRAIRMQYAQFEIISFRCWWIHCRNKTEVGLHIFSISCNSIIHVSLCRCFLAEVGRRLALQLIYVVNLLVIWLSGYPVILEHDSSLSRPEMW